ncbi:MAG: hypothetical protein IKC48_04455 [Clostridia bacterium]|nr:hypothetical protein [Clostridia bacterium]
MKNKNEKNKTFLFKSNLSPFDFIAKAKDEAAKARLGISETENCFVLKIGSKHYGEIFYSATVSAAESGSYISGEIVTVPYDDRPTPKKKKTVFQKIMSAIGYIIISPLILLGVLYVAIWMLFYTIFHGKEIQLHEEKLLSFMKHNMQCKQKEEQVEQ